jgi:seryl-tRNA synthetase
MELNGVTANSPKLAKAISKQVAKSTKSLQAQVSRLTNKLNEIKNKSPGATKSSAQPQKKMDSSLQATNRLDRAKSKPASQKAAAVQRFYKLQEKENSSCERKEITNEQEQTKWQQLLTSSKVDRKVTAIYHGIVADPDKLTSHNIAILLLCQPAFLL